MLGDVLGEIFSEIIGDALLGWLFPRRIRLSPPLKEGMWNASLGSVAAFLGGLAVLFAMLPILAFFWGRNDKDAGILIFLLVAVGLAVIAGVLARRALRVTLRRRALAIVGLWCSRLILVLGIVTAGLVLIRIIAGGQLGDALWT
jgi:uncharacterized membrane protein